MGFVDILSHTPPWVFVLGLVLVTFGLQQSETRRVSLPAAALPSLALAIVSVTGAAAAFRGNGLAVFGWVLAAGAALALARAVRLWRGVRADGRRIVMPGSWWPMVLMLAIFGLRWATGVALAVQPSLAGLPLFVFGVGAGSGLVSGLFLARGWVALDVRAGRLAAA